MKKKTASNIVIKTAALAGLCFSLGAWGWGESPQQAQAQACLNQIDPAFSWSIDSGSSVGENTLDTGRVTREYFLKDNLVGLGLGDKIINLIPVPQLPAPMQSDFNKVAKCVANLGPAN